MKTKFELVQSTDVGFEACTAFLEQQLLASLRTDLIQSANQSFVLVSKTAEDEIVGGIVASTSYDWLLVKLLWVEESSRKLGLGKQLLSQAEEKGMAIGCHSAWLDTSNPVAMHFYRKNGYCEFGRLHNEADHQPPSHQRWFLKKKL